MPDNSSSKTLHLDTKYKAYELTSTPVTNCKILFSITADSVPFEVAFVDKDRLEKEEFSFDEITQLHTTGEIENVNRPTYIVLRSETPCTVEIQVEIVKKQAPVKTNFKSELSGSPKQNTTKQLTNQSTKEYTTKIPIYKKKWFIILVCLLTISIIYYFFKYKKQTSSNSTVNPSVNESSPLSNFQSSNENSSQFLGFQ
jgi:hypothetical protein